MDMKKLEISLSVKDMPETLWLLRNRMAEILRHAAATEPPEVADRLREIATAFEMGTDG